MHVYEFDYNYDPRIIIVHLIKKEKKESRPLAAYVRDNIIMSPQKHIKLNCYSSSDFVFVFLIR